MSNLMLGVFGGMLRHLRVQRGLTLREAARKLEMDIGNYSRIENLHASPPNTRAKVEKLGKSLGLSSSGVECLVSLAFSHHVSVLQTKFSVSKSDRLK